MPSTPGSSTNTVTVWIVEDSERYRDTVRELINAQPDLTCPHGFASGEALLEHLAHHFAPELLLVDIGLPGMDGIEVVNRVHEFSPATKMVMLTIHENNDQIFDAICAGACGYLLKTATPEEILDSVREAATGGAPMTPQIARRVLNLVSQVHTPRREYGLTDREKDVLAELVEGGSKKQIAQALTVTVNTVDTHLRNIYAKLHVHSKTQAVAKAFKERLVDT